MIVMGGYTLLGINPKRWFEKKWWLLGLLWIAMYALSYFWSDDVRYWGERVQVKLPILLLPLAFSFLPKFSIKQLQVFCIGAGVILLGGAFYSLSFFIADSSEIAYYYGQAQMLPVPSGDYIRFSLMIALYVIWCIYIWPHFKNRGMKWFIAVTCIILVAFLHILAARSGLIALYIFCTGWAIFAGLKRNKWFGITAILVLFTSLYLAGTYVPTLNQRIGYFKYTIIQFREGHLTGIYSDMGRLMSYNIALDVIKEEPLKGVGAGDIYKVMEDGYHKFYPQDTDGRILVPHNQVLTVAVACGIPAALLFIWWILAPLSLVKRNRNGFFFLMIWVISLMQLMIEPALEVQMGIFVYLFFLLWQRHTFMYEKEEQTVIS